MLLADAEDKKNVGRTQHIENIVKGIIEGETRVLVSSMTMEGTFSRSIPTPVVSDFTSLKSKICSRELVSELVESA
jgi:hypothetical protein